MFRDRAMKIVRALPKKDEQDTKSHRPKEPHHKDSRDYKDKEPNGDR